MDDGSTDGSSKICDDWKESDERVKVIHQQNQGISASRNHGISLSNGSLILFVDSDYYLSTNMIEYMHHAMIDSNAGMVITDFEQGNLDDYHFLINEYIKPKVMNSLTALNNIYHSSHEELEYVVPWGKLYKKELFEDVSYPERLIFEDMYVTHKILYKCDNIAVLPQKLCYYYEHDDSIMHDKFSEKKLDYLDALKERIEFFEIHDLSDLKWKAYDKYIHALIWEYSRVRDILHDRNLLRKIKKRFREIFKFGYRSLIYPKENALFLFAFFIEPELIVLYWKVTAHKKEQIKH